MNTIVSHAGELFKQGAESTKFAEVMMQTPRIAARVARLLALQMEGMRYMALHRCPGYRCEKVFLSSIPPDGSLKWSCPKCNHIADWTYSGWQGYIAKVPKVESRTG